MGDETDRSTGLNIEDKTAGGMIPTAVFLLFMIGVLSWTGG